MLNQQLEEELHKPIVKLENVRNKKYTPLSKATFAVLILSICN